ncbi:hypothetical protein ARMGADRAFT_1087190 [Armillaria gallica]|uniref:Uncharacterized protein n=1 Tax=Armillaria gallica TaxID=47427 RepID=A0A2H3D2G5_ARMGA|nr:hypothetical protein ARMGADRAFT_1087190 [Armillaria gallica]
MPPANFLINESNAQNANDNCGNGSRSLVTNAEDCVDRPAQDCTSDDVVQLGFSGRRPGLPESPPPLRASLLAHPVKRI